LVRNNAQPRARFSQRSGILTTRDLADDKLRKWEAHMQKIRARILASLLSLLATSYACSAFATYVFQALDYPGATFTDVRGINNYGQIVGYASDGSTDPTHGCGVHGRNG
jgi:hypothetical protein